MIYHDYSCSQLEAMADGLNRRYDSSRLTQPKSVDVYDLVDMLGARIAFEYLSPDRTYLGATLFKPGLLYVWPGNPYKKGMEPEEKMFYGGTIIIDRNLNESKTEQDQFAENFTVMHECFHFDKHQAEFKHVAHLSMSFTSYSKKQSNKKTPYIISNDRQITQQPLFLCQGTQLCIQLRKCWAIVKAVSA